MRRHSIIVRLNPADTQEVVLKDRYSQVTTTRIIEGERHLGFGLGQMLAQLSDRDMYPSETALDLAILALAINAADTRISRTTESQDSWTREIDLYVPVKDPSLWLGNSSLLERMLKFLTGDLWRVFFHRRPYGLENLVDIPAGLLAAPFTSVCLFSGGLDSFVGAIDLLEAGENPLFVSHYWDLSTSSQKPCARLLGAVYGNMEPRHVRVHIGFPDNLVAGSAPEMSTRGRSFLFFSLAAMVASALDGNTPIYVPENGLISLNVPLDPLRLGAWSTRTTHPFYMARWQDLLDSLGISAHLENPYRFKTKAEMLTECTNMQFLRQNVATTISCSSISKARWRGLSPKHCGFCVPCLIRRTAIQVAFGDDSTDYLIGDLADRPLNAKNVEAQHVRSFQMMRRRLTQHPELARTLIYKSGPFSDYSQGEINDYIEVFRRGIVEVGTIVDDVIVRPS